MIETNLIDADDVPIHFVAGESDPVSGFGAHARELARRLGQSGASATERFYPGARREVRNEINRDEALADITQWFRSCVEGIRP